jgi:hypothetical protein
MKTANTRTEVIESMAQVARLGTREWLRRKGLGHDL